jgi:TatD DNase family protein
MGLIDSHCHLDFPQFDADRDEVLARAVEAGVTAIINPGADLESSRRAVALAERYDNVYAAVGVHPHDASTLDPQVLAELRQLAAHPKVVAIGEIGLDYYRDLSPRPQQRAAFDAQLALAADLKLPVIVHQREAAADVSPTCVGDVLAALRAWAAGSHPGGVLHAFSGDEAMADEAVTLGFFIGLGGPLTYKNARRLPELVPHLPLDRLLLETDAPYLPPHPYRGQRNAPAYLVLVAQRLAELRGLPLEVLARQVTENTRRVFRLAEAGSR